MIEFFYEDDEKNRTIFELPVFSGVETGSIFNPEFDKNNLKKIGVNPHGTNWSAGSIGFYLHAKDLASSTIEMQVRSDAKDGCIDIDVTARDQNTNKFRQFKKTGFHNNPFESCEKGFKTGFIVDDEEYVTSFSDKEVKDIINKSKKKS